MLKMIIEASDGIVPAYIERRDAAQITLHCFGLWVGVWMGDAFISRFLSFFLDFC